MAGTKRIYAMPMSQSVRPMKKIKFTRKSSRKVDWTSQSGLGHGITFSNRRRSRQDYNRLLWDSSTAATHYRSNQSALSNISTPTSASIMSTTIVASRRLGGNNFWTALGGAINPDGGTIPTFTTNSDFTVRGGMFGIRITNTPDALDLDKDALNVVVFLVKTTKNWNATNVPATVNVGWEPTLVQDFQTNIGKTILRRSFLLAEGESMTIEERMSLQKIDQSEYTNSQSELVWIVLAGNTTASSAKSLVMTSYFNLSFVGDAV